MFILMKTDNSILIWACRAVLPNITAVIFSNCPSSQTKLLRSLAFAAMLFFETVPVKLRGRPHPAYNDCRDGPPYGCPRVPFWRCNIHGISGAPASMPAPQGTCSPAGSRSPHEIYAPRVPESYRSYTPVSPLTRLLKGLPVGWRDVGKCFKGSCPHTSQR